VESLTNTAKEKVSGEEPSGGAPGRKGFLRLGVKSRERGPREKKIKFRATGTRKGSKGVSYVLV